MDALWANIAIAASILLAGLSLTLFILGAVAATRLGNTKLWFITLAFAAFAVQGAYLAFLAWERRADVAAESAGEFPVLAVGSLAIVILLYLGVLKR